jgi:hypothetical protein
MQRRLNLLLTLDFLPNVISKGSENVTARDIIVVKHVTLGEDLLIPSRKIVALLVLNTHLMDIF